MTTSSLVVGSCVAAGPTGEPSRQFVKTSQRCAVVPPEAPVKYSKRDGAGPPDVDEPVDDESADDELVVVALLVVDDVVVLLPVVVPLDELVFVCPPVTTTVTVP